MRPILLSPAPWIVGHRGAAGEEIENTLKSVLLAIEQRADLVEIDVQLTADGDLVVFHDWTLERLAGRPETVEQMPLDRLRGVRLLGTHGNGGRIASLDEILTAVPDGVALNLEIKRRGADRQLLASRLLRGIAGRPGVLVSSFDWELLTILRSLDADLPLAPLGKKNRSALARAGKRLGAVSLHAHRRISTAYLMRLAKRDRRPVLAYTVNEPEEARELLALGVAGLFTDFPGRLRRSLAGTPATDTPP